MKTESEGYVKKNIQKGENGKQGRQMMIGNEKIGRPDQRLEDQREKEKDVYIYIHI